MDNSPTGTRKRIVWSAMSFFPCSYGGSSACLCNRSEPTTSKMQSRCTSRLAVGAMRQICQEVACAGFSSSSGFVSSCPCCPCCPSCCCCCCCCCCRRWRHVRSRWHGKNRSSAAAEEFKPNLPPLAEVQARYCWTNTCRFARELQKAFWLSCESASCSASCSSKTMSVRCC